MTNNNPAGTTTTAPAVEWDHDLIFHVLSDGSRRRILLTLAKEGPKTAEELKVHARSYSKSNRSNLIIKHLVVLRKSGLVLMNDNPRDGRRALYCLSPAVKVTRSESAALLDLGFCKIEL